MTAKPRLGIVLSTVTDAPVEEFIDIAQLAERNGYESVLVNEGRGDALACAQAVGSATERINTGTNIANIYLRHPFLAASTLRTIAEVNQGRLVAGFGVSHRGLLRSLGIDMGDARSRLRDYVVAVRNGLRGELGTGFLTLPAAAHHVPVCVAANTLETAAVAGACGDGLMPYLTPNHAVTPLMNAALEARSESPLSAEPFECIMSIPTFVHDDLDAARSAARYNLAFFSNLPNYRRQWRRAGYATAMDAAKRAWETGSRRDVAAQIPDELIDTVCVFGPPAQCRRQLDAFRGAGVAVPVLAVSPVNAERLPATRTAIEALAPASASS